MNTDTRHKTQDTRLKIQDSKMVLGLLSMVFGLILAGCAEQKYEAAEQICMDDVDKRQAMEVAEDVLANMHFTIEKADVESYFIKTKPLPGAQFFEFWRSDNVSATDSLEANLHSIRRTVELDINQQNNRLCIGCNVKIQRLSLPEHRVSSSGRAYEMFSKSSSSLQKIRLNPEQRAGMAWVDLGRDRQLAAEILKRIENRMKSEE